MIFNGHSNGWWWLIMIIHNDHIYTNWLAPSIGTAQSFPAKWTLQHHLLPYGSYTVVWKEHLYLSILCNSLHAVCVCVCVWYCLIVFWIQVFFPQILSPFQKLRKTLYWTCSVWVPQSVIIYVYIYIWYGSIPIDTGTFLVGWTSIYQLSWGSLGTRVLTHPHIYMVYI